VRKITRIGLFHFVPKGNVGDLKKGVDSPTINPEQKITA
jgi:hypothetical protein